MLISWILINLFICPFFISSYQYLSVITMLYTNLFFSFTSSPTASTSNHTTLHKLILCPLHSPIITPIYTGLYSALSHFQPLHLRNNRTDLHQFIFLQPLPLHLIIWAIFFYFRPKICGMIHMSSVRQLMNHHIIQQFFRQII